MRAVVFKGVDDFAEWWDTAKPAAHFLPFQNPCVMQVWERTLGAASDTRCYVVRVDDDQGAPLFAVFLNLSRTGRFGLRTLRFMDGDVIDYNAPILFEPVQPITISAPNLWLLIRSALPHHDFLKLDKIPASVKGRPNPLWNPDNSQHHSSGHVMSLPNSWEDVEIEKGRHETARVWKRKMRRLSEQGSIQLVMADTPDEKHHTFGAFMIQRRERFKEMGLANIFDNPAIQAFYLGCIEQINAGVSYLSSLKVDQEIVATNFGFLDSDQLIFVLTSFASGRWARYSTGHLHLQMLIRWAVERRLRYFDFGMGDEEYKMFWCDQRIELRDTHDTISFEGQIFQQVRRALAAMHSRTPISDRRLKSLANEHELRISS